MAMPYAGFDEACFTIHDHPMRSPPGSRKSPRMAGDLVTGVLSGSGMQAHAADLKLIRRWVLIVGPDFSRNVRPAFSKGDILYLNARTDAWAQETRNLEPVILGKIRETGAGDYRHLNVRTQRWPEQRTGRKPEALPPPPQGALGAQIEERIAQIEDQILRDAVRSFVYYHSKERTE